MIWLAGSPGSVRSENRLAVYRVADQLLGSAAPLAALAPLRDDHELAACAPAMTPTAAVPGAAWRLAYSGPGWLADAWRQVECWTSEAGYRLALPGAGQFSVARYDGSIHIEAHPLAGASISEEVFLGPALTLALALQGIWCLHASAVASDAGLIAFLGESGRGKSTLASYLGRRRRFGWRPASDDILPVRLMTGDPCALPRFPQLKLAADRQPWQALPHQMPLRALYVLAPEGSDDIVCDAQDPRSAALAVIRHTVASRLFAGDLLAEHLAFGVQLAERIPVRRLAYPRRRSILPGVAQALAADLELS